MPDFNVWLPVRDTGIDLLVTNAHNSKSVSLQIKLSRDFRHPTQPEFAGWFKSPWKKLEGSRADLWILVIQPLRPKQTHYIIIEPKVLQLRLEKIHKKRATHFDISVNSKKECFEVRGLPKRDLILIEAGEYKDPDPSERNFTEYLNAWRNLRKKLR